MTLSSFILILQRQLTHKWGRFLLASGGIMIGIWAITLTTSLSFGLSDTVVKAINSQPSAKEFSLYKTIDLKTSFFDIQEAPKFVAIGKKEITELKNKNPHIVSISSQSILNLFLNTSGESCVQQSNKNIATATALANLSVDPANSNQTDEAITAQQKSQTDFDAKCRTISIVGGSYQNFYESNKTKWLGSTQEPTVNEIVTCFKCGSLDLGKVLGASEPKDLIGKTINTEYQSAPVTYEAGKVVDVLNADRGSAKIKTQNSAPLKIVAVVDDRDDNAFGGGNTNFYVQESLFTEAIKLAKPETNIENIGFVQYSVVVDDYNNLDKVLESLKNDKYLAFSLLQNIINSIKTAFIVLQIVLAGFGFIALIASVFGIVNVMTISVLERQKEIGILKSLGAKNSDIFNIFLIESAMLGIIGWLLGTLISVGMGYGISAASIAIINSNKDWKANLDALNIQSFGPQFPWWLFVGTLLIALIFTIMSGVFPAIKASRQNPVDVLRAE
jgi:ABC-type antimicrobial peptide transport system permease subunit